MSYAGMYDPTPVPEPKRKPEIKVDLLCGEQAWGEPWWMSDPLYGGWKRPDMAWCPVHKKREHVEKESWPPERRYPK